MDAKARNLNQIFDGTISFQIPLFQRPYVWNEPDNWAPLWDDLHGLLVHHLRTERIRTHFLGAVVLEQMNNVAGSIETHQVIDGQQRFTTLQLVMLAARDISRELSQEKYYDRFNDLVTNKPSKVDYEHERFKVWPTNSDREAFKALHAHGSEGYETSDLTEDEPLESPESLAGVNNQRAVAGYCYFAKQLKHWLAGDFEDEDSPSRSVEERFDALWKVISSGLQVVVINLDDDDESQVIFETLNARGTQLLPADLIKNYLFRRAQSEGQDLQHLYKTYWQAFDADFWRKEVKQGRLKRPRIDLFLQHYLTLMLRDEVRTAHLFEAFKDYVHTLEEISEQGYPDGRQPSFQLTAQPITIEQHLRSLARYAKAFKTFVDPPENSRLATFLKRLEAVDTATVFPLLLLACDQLLPKRQDEFDRFLNVLESFLVRRMICCLTGKNYNRLFVDVIRTLDRRGEISAEALRETLQANEGESVRFPSDEELRASILETPVYKQLAQYKIRMILEALDQAEQSRKSEPLTLPKDLTIEHVMPVSWGTNWPVPTEINETPEKRIEFVQQRDRAVHTLGNLTLITSTLNPSLSNASWEIKRPELVKFSKLNLNRYFHLPSAGEDDPVQDWDEQAILTRGDVLFDAAAQIWPY